MRRTVVLVVVEKIPGIGGGLCPIGRGGNLNLGVAVKFMSTDPKQMRKFAKEFPAAVLPGSGKVKMDQITPQGAGWQLIIDITQYITKVRTGKHSPLDLGTKLKLKEDVDLLAEKFREYSEKGASVANVITYIYRVWNCFKQDYPNPLKVWDEEDIRHAINEELVDKASVKKLKVLEVAYRNAQRAQRQGGRGRGTSRRNRRRQSGGANSGGMTIGGGGRGRRGTARPPNPKHNKEVRLPANVGGVPTCLYFNKGICDRPDSGVGCRWKHLCCYCGKTNLPYYECKCANALAVLKPAGLTPQINLLNT